MRWRLFLDESGQFDNSREEAAVVGVLVSATVDGRLLGRVRATLQEVEPGIPWPLHAAHYNVVPFLALVSSGRRGGAPHVPGSELELRDRASDTVLAFLERNCPALVGEARADLSAARMPRVQVLKAMQEALATSREDGVRTAVQALEDVTEEIRTRFRLGMWQTLDPSPHIHGFPVAAGESERGDGERDCLRILGAAEARRRQPPAQRYLAGFAAVVVRVEDLLELIGGNHEVHLRASRFQVGRAEVNRADLAAILRRCGRPAAPVQWQVEDPEAYFHERLDPCFTLADYAANQVFRCLKWAGGKTLAMVEADLRASVGAAFRVHSTRGALTSLSATGVAREFVVRARNQPQQLAGLVPTLAAARPWAAEQAREWATLLSGAGQ